MELITEAAYFLILLVAVQANSSELKNRMMGGLPQKIEKIPYQLSLESSGKHICGASILNEKRAITAAHCTYGIGFTNLKVRVGSNDTETGGQLINISSIVQHPYFDNNTLEHDISILLLETPIKMNKAAKAIDLPKNEIIKVNTTVLTSGWNGKQLHVFNLSIVDRDVCQKIFPMARITMKICALSIIASERLCKNDTGNALVLNNTLIGIASWTDCDSDNSHTTFTNVQNYVEFIKKYSNGALKMSLSNIAYVICILHIMFNSLN